MLFRYTWKRNKRFAGLEYRLIVVASPYGQVKSLHAVVNKNSKRHDAKTVAISDLMIMRCVILQGPKSQDPKGSSCSWAFSSREIKDLGI